MASMLILEKSRKPRYLCLDRWCANSAKQTHQENRSRLVQILSNPVRGSTRHTLEAELLPPREEQEHIASSADRHSSRACDVEVQKGRCRSCYGKFS